MHERREVKKMMTFSAAPIFRLVLLLVLLPSQGVAAQESAAPQPAPAALAFSPAAPAPTPTVPHLADLIPLVSALSDRFADLQTKLKRGADSAELKDELAGAATHLTKFAAEFDTLKSATIGGGQLARLQAEITSEGEMLAKVSKSVADESRNLVDLRNEWIAEQKQWKTWRAAVITDEPLPEIVTAFDTADRTIDTALQRLNQQIRPLLVLQEQAGGLQSTHKTLAAAVNRLSTPVVRRDAVLDVSPPMFSAAYVSQVQAGLRQPLNAALDQIVQRTKAFLTRQGWLVLLQGILALVLVLLLFRHRQQLADSERWRSVAQRPIATGLFTSVMLGMVFYIGPPVSVVFAYTLVGGVAFARLVSALVGPSWRVQRVYGLIALLVLTRFFYMVNLATPLLRLYILVAALVSCQWCWRWAVSRADKRETSRFAWGCSAAAVFFIVVAWLELWGEAELGEFLFTSALSTLILLPGVRLLRHFIHGWVEWLVYNSPLNALPLIGRNAVGIAQRLRRVMDLLLSALLLTALLTVWNVYATPTQALAASLSWDVTIGGQRFTVGDGLVAVGVVYSALFCSWLVQQLLLEETPVTQRVERTLRLSIAHLMHYGVLFLGFLLALIVLGLDLTKLALLMSALGIGVGLAAKDLLASFFGGLMIYLDRPFVEGDWIRSPDREIEGTVEKIGVRLTRIRTFDRRPLYVPNSIFSTTTVENPSRMWNRRIFETIGIRYEDIAKMAGIVHDVDEMLRVHPDIDTTQTLMVNFTTFAASSLNFFVYTFTKTTNWQRYHQVKQDVLLRVAEIIATHGAEIAFPTTTVHVPNGLVVQQDEAEEKASAPRRVAR